MPPNSIKLTALRIDLLELAETTKRLRNFTPTRIEFILKKADEKIKITSEILNPFIEDLCYNEQFLALAKIPYENPNSKLIKAAVADYFLTH